MRGDAQRGIRSMAQDGGQEMTPLPGLIFCFLLGIVSFVMSGKGRYK